MYHLIEEKHHEEGYGIGTVILSCTGPARRRKTLSEPNLVIFSGSSISNSVY